MSSSRKIFGNAAYLAATNGMSLVVAFVFAKLTSVYLRPYLFGQMILVLSITTFLETTMRGSLNLVVTHKVAQKAGNAAEYWWPAMILHAGFSVIFLGVSLGIAMILGGGDRIVPAIVFSVLVSVFRLVGDVAVAVQRGADQMAPEFWTTMLERGLYMGAVVWIISHVQDRSYAGFVALFSANAVTQGIQMILLLAPTWRKLRTPFRVDRERLNDLVVSTKPLWISALFVILHSRLEVFFLKGYRLGPALGYYGAATKLVDAIRVMPWLLGMALFPALTRQAARSREDFAERYVLTAKLFVLASLPIAVVLVASSNLLIGFVYTDQFARAVPALRLLALAIVPLFLNSLFSFGAMAVEKQSLIALAHVPAVVAQAVLAAILVPRYQELGAATSVLVSEMLLLTGSLWLTRRHIAPFRWSALLPAFGCVAATGAGLALGASQGNTGMAFGGLGAYIAALMFLPVLTPLEKKQLRRDRAGEPPTLSGKV